MTPNPGNPKLPSKNQKTCGNQSRTTIQVMAAFCILLAAGWTPGSADFHRDPNPCGEPLHRLTIQVQDQYDGQPIPEATIIIQEAADFDGSWFIQCAYLETGPNGTATIDMPDGNWILSVHVWYGSPSWGGDYERHNEHFQIAAGDPASTITVNLKREVPPSAVLTGRLLHAETGQPAANTDIIALAVDRPWESYQYGSTDFRGNFRIPVTQGNHHILTASDIYQITSPGYPVTLTTATVDSFGTHDLGDIILPDLPPDQVTLDVTGTSWSDIEIDLFLQTHQNAMGLRYAADSLFGDGNGHVNASEQDTFSQSLVHGEDDLWELLTYLMGTWIWPDIHGPSAITWTGLQGPVQPTTPNPVALRLLANVDLSSSEDWRTLVIEPLSNHIDWTQHFNLPPGATVEKMVHGPNVQVTGEGTNIISITPTNTEASFSGPPIHLGISDHPTAVPSAQIVGIVATTLVDDDGNTGSGPVHDSLEFTMQVDITQYGYYSLVSALWRTDPWQDVVYAPESNTGYYEPGTYDFSFQFDQHLLRGIQADQSGFNLTAILLQNGGDQLLEIHTSQVDPVDWSDFGTPKVQLNEDAMYVFEDRDGDDRVDALRLVGNVTINQAGPLMVRGALQTLEGEWTEFDSDIDYVYGSMPRVVPYQMEWDLIGLATAGYEGPFTLGLTATYGYSYSDYEDIYFGPKAWTKTFEVPSIELDVPTPDAYEPDDDIHKATTTMVGGVPQTHTFHQIYDMDWIQFDAQGGTFYTISTINIDYFNFLGRDVTVFDADGNPLIHSRWHDQFSWKAPVDGTYYIVVSDSSYHPFGFSEQTYRLHITPSTVAVEHGMITPTAVDRDLDGLHERLNLTLPFETFEAGYYHTRAVLSAYEPETASWTWLGWHSESHQLEAGNHAWELTIPGADLHSRYAGGPLMIKFTVEDSPFGPDVTGVFTTGLELIDTSFAPGIRLVGTPVAAYDWEEGAELEFLYSYDLVAIDLDEDGLRSPDEPLYITVNWQDKILPGDVRLSATPEGSPGSTVKPGDADVNNTAGELITLDAATFRFLDSTSGDLDNHEYDAGEAVFLDVDQDQGVSVGDLEITELLQAVTESHPQLGIDLLPLQDARLMKLDDYQRALDQPRHISLTQDTYYPYKLAIGAIRITGDYDDQPPTKVAGLTLTGLNPAPSWNTIRDGTVTWSAATDNVTGVAGYHVTLGATTYMVEETQFALLDLADGIHDLTVAAVDGAGNVGEAATTQIKVDTTPPTMATLDSASHPHNTCAKGTVATFQWTGNDATSGLHGTTPMTYQLDGGQPVTVTQSPAKINGLGQGFHEITWVLQDAAGNTVNQTRNMTVDIQAPVLNLTLPNATNSKNPKLSWTLTEDCGGLIDIKGLLYRPGSQVPTSLIDVMGWIEDDQDGGALFVSGLGSGNLTIPLGNEGLHRITFKVSDARNNNHTQQHFILYDTTSPSAVPSLDADPASRTSNRLIWTAATDTSNRSLQYRIERANGTGGDFSPVATVFNQTTHIDASGIQAGQTYRYRVIAIDEAGNEANPSPVANVQVPDVERLHTAPPTLTKTMADKLGAALDRNIQALDKDGDGRYDGFHDPNGKLVLQRVARINGEDALLLGPKGQRPTMIWLPDKDQVLEVVSKSGKTIEGTSNGLQTTAIVRVDKSDGWIDIVVKDPGHGHKLLHVTTADGRVIPLEQVARINGVLYILDDPEVEYLVVYEGDFDVKMHRKDTPHIPIVTLLAALAAALLVTRRRRS